MKYDVMMTSNSVTPEQRAKNTAYARKYRAKNPDKMKEYARRRSDGTPKIYFIRAGQFLKIGYTTKKPWARMTELQCGNPEELVMMYFMTGTEAQEQELHQRFAHLRIRGEWFRLETDLLQFVEVLKTSSTTTA